MAKFRSDSGDHCTDVALTMGQPIGAEGVDLKTGPQTFPVRNHLSCSRNASSSLVSFSMRAAIASPISCAARLVVKDCWPRSSKLLALSNKHGALRSSSVSRVPLHPLHLSTTRWLFLMVLRTCCATIPGKTVTFGVVQVHTARSVAACRNGHCEECCNICGLSIPYPNPHRHCKSRPFGALPFASPISHEISITERREYVVRDILRTIWAQRQLVPSIAGHV